MSRSRIEMRYLREILRLRFESKLSIRKISRCTRTSVGTIQGLLATAQQQSLSWPLPETLSDDQELARCFYPEADTAISHRLEQPDWPEVHHELKRKGMTRQLLWEEYHAKYPNRSYCYAQYCVHYKKWLATQKRSMRQLHKAGEKCFIDYSGQTMPIINGRTGEIKQAQIFVAVLGASGYTFACASWSQRLPDWLDAHVKMFEFFGGAPELLVPDNLKSAVTKACRYDPDKNVSYQQLASHYQVAVLPARPYKPKDKSKAELAVQMVQRWILARLRHQQFFSLATLNQRISDLLIDFNQRPFKQQAGCRASLFKELDQPELKPLPLHPWQYRDVKRVKIHPDYHVQYQKHFYSVPHHLVGEKLELHAGQNLIELYLHNRLVASHARQLTPGTTTLAMHMPERHCQHQYWNQETILANALKLGAHVQLWMQERFTEKQHPEQAYRIWLGVLDLGKKYPPHRLDKSCEMALKKHLNRLGNLRSMLKNCRDQLPEQDELDYQLPQQHLNIRGPDSFH